MDYQTKHYTSTFFLYIYFLYHSYGRFVLVLLLMKILSLNLIQVSLLIWLNLSLIQIFNTILTFIQIFALSFTQQVWNLQLGLKWMVIMLQQSIIQLVNIHDIIFLKLGKNIPFVLPENISKVPQGEQWTQIWVYKERILFSLHANYWFHCGYISKTIWYDYNLFRICHTQKMECSFTDM